MLLTTVSVNLVVANVNQNSPDLRVLNYLAGSIKNVPTMVLVTHPVHWNTTSVSANRVFEAVIAAAHPRGVKIHRVRATANATTKKVCVFATQVSLVKIVKFKPAPTTATGQRNKVNVRMVCAASALRVSQARLAI